MKNLEKLPLFRQEALEYSTQRSFLSHVILTTPVHLWVSTMTLLGFTAVGLCFSSMVKVPRSAELSGQIEVQPQKEGKVFARLWADANTVDNFRLAQDVQVKYDAFPFTTYGVFEGQVKAIATQPVTVATPQFTSEVPLYPLEVELKQQQISTKGKLSPLRPGMTLTATVVLERRTLFNWLLEPLTRRQNNG